MNIIAELRAQAIVSYCKRIDKHELLSEINTSLVSVSKEMYFKSISPAVSADILIFQVDSLEKLCANVDTTWSLNVDPRILANPSLVNGLREKIANSNLNFAIEITETSPLPNSERVNKIFDSFRRIGCDIYLDDFGAGYATESAVLQYAFDGIKLDRCLLHGINSSTKVRDKLSRILKLTNRLSLKHVVEGVETASTLDILLEQGFTCFQGYYFGAPSPIHGFRDSNE